MRSVGDGGWEHRRVSETVPPGDDPQALTRKREFVKEAVTMALYLSLSVLAVLLAIPTSTTEDPIGLVFLTSVGLLAAHLLAFAISSRLVSSGELDSEARVIIGAQIVAGVFVVTLVMIPMLVFDAPLSVQLAEGLLIAFVAWIGYLAARQANASKIRSFIYVGVVILSVVVVLGLKAAVGH